MFSDLWNYKPIFCSPCQKLVEAFEKLWIKTIQGPVSTPHKGQ